MLLDDAAHLADFKIRLVNGSSSQEGRVEVQYQGIWGTVCDDYWSIADATVVCRQLGFDHATEAISNGLFGQGTGQELNKHLHCCYYYCCCYCYYCCCYYCCCYCCCCCCYCCR